MSQPNIQPITAMFFVAVLYLGLVDGLLIMALTMSISGFIFGFGPWVFNQIDVYKRQHQRVREVQALQFLKHLTVK